MNSIFLLIAFVITLIYVPIVKWIAIRLNIVDVPNARKMHSNPKPLLGGVAIFASILTVYLYYLKFQVPEKSKIYILLALLLLIVGIIDDKFDIKAWQKLFFQVLVAVITTKVMGGITSVEVYQKTMYFSTLTGMVIQTMWFLVLINAFNLIDGLDGLATGTGIFSFVTMLIIALVTKDMNNVNLLYIIIGSLFGFLFYNYFPSTIFLGDAGSMVIGYLVAILSINDYKTVTLTSMTFLMLIVFLPILDVILSFSRRKLNGEGAFKADALHFHHRLMRRGYSHQKTVLVMYSFMLIYVIGAILISITPFMKLKFVIAAFLFVVTVVIIEKFYLLSDKYAYCYKFFRWLLRKGK